MVVGGIGIFLSIFGIYAVRTKEDSSMKSLLLSLNIGVWLSSALILVALAFMAWGPVWANLITPGIFYAVVVGLAAGLIIGQATEYFTSDEYKPTKNIAKQALKGPATLIIEGVAVGMYSTWIPVLTIVLAIMGSFWVSGGSEHFAMGVY